MGGKRSQAKFPGMAASLYYSFFAKPFYGSMWNQMIHYNIDRADALQRGSWGEATVRPGRK